MRGVAAFRTIAVAEAVSWLLLIVATVVKYTAGNAWGVHVLGPIHGVLFVVYVVVALFPVRRALRWPAGTLVWVLVESVLPGGGFAAARREDVRRARAGTPGSGDPSAPGTPRTAGTR